MANLDLSDNEKRDVRKYLEKGKHLPDKYRFLLFEDKREVELIWNGKTNEITNLVLPFQTIEHIDEPRSEEQRDRQVQLFDTSGQQIQDWTNKLIWGDNKLILSSLKNGPLRREIEAQGGLKLIYIDPPFDVGADFSMNIEIGDESFTKKPSVIEEIAYRDTWGKGADSFISMIYERLSLMRDLLADDGSIYVHCDYRVNSYIKIILDELLGREMFRNEIVWHYQTYQGQVKNYFPRKHDTILIYSKTDSPIFHLLKDENPEQTIDFTRWNQYLNENNEITGANYPKTDSRFKGYYNRFLKENHRKPGPNDVILRIEGNTVDSVWNVKAVDPKDLREKVDYPTQKPEKLLERIMKASSSEGDIIADFFCGSGTTLAVAEKLGRKWIGSDLGRFSIHTTRKRMIGIQRELKKAGKNFRPFEILNIGKYEREYYVSSGMDLRKEQRAKVLERKEKEFIKLILAAYKAEPVDSFTSFVGKKRDRLVAVGPIDNPITSSFIEDVVTECREKEILKADILGFDYEMGIDFSEIRQRGVDLQFKVIPREVFDRKAVEKGQVKFYDVAYIEVKPVVKKKTIAIELTDFSVFYNQENTGEIEEKLSAGSSKIAIEDGKVIKLTKDKASGIIEREILTKHWADWVDYWAIDFNFASKKEIMARQKENGEIEEVWTGNYIFENEWQSFRTKKNRNLELISSSKEVLPGKYKIAVKVVDIFGNDTTKVIEVNV